MTTNHVDTRPVLPETGTLQPIEKSIVGPIPWAVTIVETAP